VRSSTIKAEVVRARAIIVKMFEMYPGVDDKTVADYLSKNALTIAKLRKKTRHITLEQQDYANPRECVSKILAQLET